LHTPLNRRSVNHAVDDHLKNAHARYIDFNDRRGARRQIHIGQSDERPAAPDKPGAEA